MAKPEWGTKRTCDGCGKRFYDLNRSPVTCPQCGTVLATKKTPAKPARTEAAIPAPVAVAAAPAAAKDKDDPGGADSKPIEDDDDDLADLEDDEEIEDEEADLIEDASDLSEDEDDVSVVKEHFEQPAED